MEQQNQFEVTFIWKYGGQEVKLAGVFNDWKPEYMNYDNTRNVHVLIKHVPRGAYKYKFVVDGSWCYDVERPTLVDSNGICNNVITIDLPVLVPFWWKLAGKRVVVLGTFNNWTAEQMDEVKVGEGNTKHYKELVLPLGFYQYKFVADDRWGYDDHQPHNYFDGVLNNFRQVDVGQIEHFYYHSPSANIGLHYLAYLPEQYATGEQKPLILYLHGAKHRGDNIQLVEQGGIPDQLKKGKKLDAIVLAPQCPRHGQFNKWTSCTVFLMDLVEHWCRTRNVDRKRIYVTGAEMGAYGAWKLISTYPDVFAAVAVFAGGVDKTKIKQIAHIPVWACDNRYQESFHETQEVIETLREMGTPVNWIVNEADKLELSEYWQSSYSDDQFYNWLCQHKKQN